MRREGSKWLPSLYQFFPWNLPKTVFLLISTALPHWCKISSLHLMPVLNYWTWTKTTSQEKRFLWSNPYKNHVMITSLIEMLQLPNFGHMKHLQYNLNQRYNSAKFRHCRICVTDFREGGLFVLLSYVSSPQNAHLE